MAQTVALTFDDGPNPDSTPLILELLASENVRATFFVWGERAREQPELLRRTLDAGHTLAPHCWEHVSHWTRDAAAIAGDIDRTLALLAQAGAPAPTLWRPPYGHLLAGVTRALAAERGLALAGWTINPHDYAGHAAADMLDGVRAQIEAREDAVVLLHDGHRESGPVQRRPSAANTVELVRGLLGQGFAFVPLLTGLEDSIEERGPGGA